MPFFAQRGNLPDESQKRPTDAVGFFASAAAYGVTMLKEVELLRNRAIDLVQPDACRAGGITECRRIADLADYFGIAFQPQWRPRNG